MYNKLSADLNFLSKNFEIKCLKSATYVHRMYTSSEWNITEYSAFKMQQQQ